MADTTCPACAAPFAPMNGSQVYCDARCREKMKWQRFNRVHCSSCGARTGYKAGQVDSATCNPCRRNNWEHGTSKGYRGNGCRCEACIEWNRVSHRDYTAQRAAGVFDTVPCSVDQCERYAHGRAMCKMHYRRWARANGMIQSPSDQWSDARRSNYHARRARLNGGRNGDRVLLSEIIARDGTNCAACHEPVDLDRAWPDRMSKSIDHRQPLSKGGGHELDNCQLMHFACNSSKGARVSV